MRPEDRDPAYLWDMLEAAHQVREFTEGTTMEGFLGDRKLQLAVERCVEIIGEAARRISETLKAAIPHVPWRDIVAQRNVLAHDYGEIRQDRMWAVATEGIPALIPLLESLLPPLPTT